MKRLTPVLVGLVALLIAGCGSSDYKSSSSSPSGTPAAAANAYGGGAATASSTPSPGGEAVVTTKTSKLGTVLAGAKGKTLYLFEADKGNASACSGACATAWPPLTTSGSATSAKSAVAGDLGTIKRSDGTKQVTYKGHPLYYFARTKTPATPTGRAPPPSVPSGTSSRLRATRSTPS